MRILLVFAVLAGIAAGSLASAATALAQEGDDPLDELSSAGIPLTIIPAAPVQQQVPPGQVAPGEQPPPDTLVDLPIPNPIDVIPNPLDWLPGSLNPLNWARDIVTAVFTLIGEAMLEAIRGFIDWATGSSLNFVTRTPAVGTYDSPTVRSLYDFSRAIVNSSLAVIVMWGGFNVVIKEHTRSPYHEAMELLPRVILAALAANLAIEFVRMLIDINNAIASGVGDVALPGYDAATPQQEGIALIFAAIAYGIVAVLLVFQMLMRLALIAMLIVLGPIAALLWVLPQTQQWARWWADLVVITVFQQAIQVMVLSLGAALMVELAPGGVSNSLLTLLLGLAVCWLTLKVPSLLRSARTQAGITNVLTLAMATHAIGAVASRGGSAAAAAGGRGAASGAGGAGAASAPAAGRA